MTDKAKMPVDGGGSQASPADGSGELASRRDGDMPDGAPNPGESGGGPYPNPYDGGGSDEAEDGRSGYFGGGQLGERDLGGNSNAGRKGD